MVVFTIGHSTRTAAELIALLRDAEIAAVVDVRRFPGSRRHPQFNAETLERSLADSSIRYRHLAALGGRRGAREAGGESPHTLWREAAFRNYADYAETADFRAAFAELLTLARERRSAIMCAEALWWRCHRRIIADYLIASGIAVEHVLAPGKIEPAQLTTGAAPRPDGTILYGAARLL